MSVELIQAIRMGDASSVKQLLEAGVDPNFHMPAESDHGLFLDQVTPLMVAVAAPKATAEVVRLLLDHGADPFAVSEGEVSPTWYASGGGTGYPLTEANLADLEPDHTYHHWGGGDAERLGLILDAGGDPNEFANNGRSCVYEACSVGDPARLRLLLERGAKVGPARPPESGSYIMTELLDQEILASLRDVMEGFSHQAVPLFAASAAGSLDCVKLIVEAGFPAGFKVGGINAFSDVGSVEVAEYLWNQGVRPGAGTFGFDAIDNAIEAENLTVLRFLLGKEDQAMIQQKLIMASGIHMNPKVVRALIELGADANKPDESHGSPLHYACWQGDGNGGREKQVAETVQALIDAGADPNLLSRGKRPLHEAVFGDWGSPKSVEVLLRNGADVNALNEHGQTALMLAAQHGEPECVRLLLNGGADRTLKDKQGKTAFDHAHDHLQTWTHPVSKFIGLGLGKALGYIGIPGEGVAEKALVEAQTTVELLRR